MRSGLVDCSDGGECNAGPELLEGQMSQHQVRGGAADGMEVVGGGRAGEMHQLTMMHEKWKCCSRFEMIETHPALVNTGFAQMTLHVVKLIALVVWLVSLNWHRLRDKLLMLLVFKSLLLLLLLSQILAGFDGDGRGERMRRTVVLRSVGGGRRRWRQRRCDACGCGGIL